MKVTNLQYALENKLIKKLDRMIDRCMQPAPKKDALLIIEGSEGEGKTNTSAAISYYVKSKTNREIHLFFRLESMLRFAQSTEGKIIIWDEPALDALGTDWYKETNKNLIRLLMTARKKRHFLIFNLTKFYKFAEYVVVDRALGLIHMYSRNEIEPGRFAYIRKKYLEALYLGYRTSKKRLYNKLKAFGGRFSEVLEKYFDKMDIHVEGTMHATYADYEREKDKAILGIGKQEVTKVSYALNKEMTKVRNFKRVLSKLNYPINNIKDLARELSVTTETVYSWGRNDQNESENLGNEGFKADREANYDNHGKNGINDDGNKEEDTNGF